MSKYVPKIGDSGFLWFNIINDNWDNCGKVLAVTTKQIAYLDANGDIKVISNLHEFRPIPTKADVEREQLNKTLANYVTSETSSAVFAIQDLGFTIPKKVKRSEIYNAFRDSIESLHFISADTATDEMVNFLGDLVESDV